MINNSNLTKITNCDKRKTIIAMEKNGTFGQLFSPKAKTRNPLDIIQKLKGLSQGTLKRIIKRAKAEEISDRMRAKRATMDNRSIPPYLGKAIANNQKTINKIKTAFTTEKRLKASKQRDMDAKIKTMQESKAKKVKAAKRITKYGLEAMKTLKRKPKKIEKKKPKTKTKKT